MDKTDDADLLETMADCVEPEGLFETFAKTAAALDDWHAGGRRGPRPSGRLRRMGPPDLSRVARSLALGPYLALNDPDGRPGPLRKRDAF